MHDRIAELRGLRAEHTQHTQSRDGERAGQVEAAIARVVAAVDADIERLENEAADLADRGQHFPAADRAELARILRAGLAELALPMPAKRGAEQTAAAAPAPETARGGE
ncbi:hypothetical protein ABZW30_12420 [Kitasatospora sp. NPDC004669]|uniref:hypothetical protein n=1 Tax=Kitasatospora sp. NPDC004669 TaxID=3154555 RepID=UPI0033B94B6F